LTQFVPCYTLEYVDALVMTGIRRYQPNDEEFISLLLPSTLPNL